MAKIELAGAGFLNITLRPEWIAQAVSFLVDDPRCGILPTSSPMTIVIDYSAPNVAKCA